MFQVQVQQNTLDILVEVAEAFAAFVNCIQPIEQCSIFVQRTRQVNVGKNRSFPLAVQQSNKAHSTVFLVTRLTTPRFKIAV